MKIFFSYAGELIRKIFMSGFISRGCTDIDVIHHPAKYRICKKAGVLRRRPSSILPAAFEKAQFFKERDNLCISGNIISS